MLPCNLEGEDEMKGMQQIAMLRRYALSNIAGAGNTRGMKWGTQLRSNACALLIVFLACAALSGQRKPGTVCVAPNPSEPPTRISPGGNYNPATLSVKIDKRQPILWPHKESVKIGDLDLAERHLVVLTSDGRRIESFWFRFAEYNSGELCVSFDGYQRVQLRDTKSSPWCKCK